MHYVQISSCRKWAAKVSTTVLLAATALTYLPATALTHNQHQTPSQFLFFLPAFSMKPSCLTMMYLVQDIRGQTRHWSDSARRLIGLSWQVTWTSTSRNALSANNANYLLFNKHLSPVSPLNDHGKWSLQMLLRCSFHATITAINLLSRTILKMGRGHSNEVT